MTPTPVTPVFGGAALGIDFQGPKEVAAVFSALKELDVTHIDTARLYGFGESESLIGQVPDISSYTVSSKWESGFAPGSATAENIVSAAKESLKRVGVKQFDIFYLHAPDRKTDFAETLKGVNEVYKLGIFRRFGVSNFRTSEVRAVYQIAKEKGYVLPTVYQGNYSAVARRTESLLFPTLRELGIAFYAYSPIAGGFLVKTRKQIEAGEGRFNDDVIGGMYKILYAKPSYLNALDIWNQIAEEEGVSKAELAYRWIGFHSKLRAEHGDAVIFGVSKLEQLKQTVGALRAGPLSDKAAKGIEEIWGLIEKDAPVDNFEVFDPDSFAKWNEELEKEAEKSK